MQRTNWMIGRYVKEAFNYSLNMRKKSMWLFRNFEKCCKKIGLCFDCIWVRKKPKNADEFFCKFFWLLCQWPTWWSDFIIKSALIYMHMIYSENLQIIHIQQIHGGWKSSRYRRPFNTLTVCLSADMYKTTNPKYIIKPNSTEYYTDGGANERISRRGKPPSGGVGRAGRTKIESWGKNGINSECS